MSGVDSVLLGADSLCWHTRLEAAELSIEDVVVQAAEAGAEFLQLNLHHVRSLDAPGLSALRSRAWREGLRVLASGDFVGSVSAGAEVHDGVARVEGWIERAAVLESPVLRLASGFYRAELAARPHAIAAEVEYVAAVLEAAADRAGQVGVRLLLENHSDFSLPEYRHILSRVGGGAGVFLDLINPISSFEDPLTVVKSLAPLSLAGHVKDYSLESEYVDDRYHRRGFFVRWRYPGEGVADLAALLAALRVHASGDFFLSVEGLDNRPGVADQAVRLSASLRHLRDLMQGATIEKGGS